MIMENKTNSKAFYTTKMSIIFPVTVAPRKIRRSLRVNPFSGT